MYTLTTSDFNRDFDVDIPKVKDTDNVLLTFWYNTPVFKFFLYRKTLRVNRSLTKTIEEVLTAYHKNEIKIADPEKFSDVLKEVLHQLSDLKEDFTSSEYFNKEYRKDMKSSFSTTIKKIVKLETLVLKERNKDCTKLDDLELISLVMNNNSVELQKQMNK